MGTISVSKYAQFPVHMAIAKRDHVALRKILSELPSLSNPTEIRSETTSMAEEEKADAISSIVDKRDNVPNRDTPLHLAVKLCDEAAVEMLMDVGADESLQNEQGWSALHEAICNRQENIAKIIVRHHQPLAWAKWCRRLPRLVATMKRMRDFYMEITFHFESSVIPFISKIAPSDTYKIWKIGANLRADMTLAGFDGFRIQRSDQSILFLGEGSEDGKLAPGSLCIISHKDKEIMNALDGVGAPASEVEVQQEVASMSQTNIFRPGMDVTEAVLLPQLTWRRLEKQESIGQWKAKVYEMHNVVISIKSRKVPGAMSDDDFFSSCNDKNSGYEKLDEVLSEDERKQLEHVLKLDSCDETNVNGADVLTGHNCHSCYESREIPIEDLNGRKNVENKNEKKGWFSGWRKRDQKNEGQKKLATHRFSKSVDEKGSDISNKSPSRNTIKPGRHYVDIVRGDEPQRGWDKKKPSSENIEGASRRKHDNQENEYKKGLRPILWLSPTFPLRTEELLPLLDILANKVKAIRRLRELLTTKLPFGTFPVKIALPIVPTIRVLVTFTKFEELRSVEEFSTPPSSPTSASDETPPLPTNPNSSSTWLGWMKGPYRRSSLASETSSSSSHTAENTQDPFAIPTDYVWITAEAKKKKMQEKNDANNGKKRG